MKTILNRIFTLSISIICTSLCCCSNDDEKAVLPTGPYIEHAQVGIAGCDYWGYTDTLTESHHDNVKLERHYISYLYSDGTAHLDHSIDMATFGLLDKGKYHADSLLFSADSLTATGSLRHIENNDTTSNGYDSVTIIFRNAKNLDASRAILNVIINKDTLRITEKLTLPNTYFYTEIY